MNRRFQFSLRDLLWLTLVVASLLGGMAIQRQRDKPLSRRMLPGNSPFAYETLTDRDGTQWFRPVE
jgi:hypothetical protein